MWKVETVLQGDLEAKFREELERQGCTKYRLVQEIIRSHFEEKPDYSKMTKKELLEIVENGKL